jgi:glucoamylase
MAKVILNLKIILFFTVIAQGLASNAKDLTIHNYKMKSAQVWLQKEAQIAEKLLVKNISPENTVLGTVIASPQDNNPNYFRHWVRDAGLTMDVVFQLWLKSKDGLRKKYYYKLLEDFMHLSRQNQLSANLGEPIFEVNGKPFFGPWGRPQNDGPAIRASVLAQWALKLLDAGHDEFVQNYLYGQTLPANTVVKADLEYVSTHWMYPCFDLWEEVKADHFYTKMVQRKAMILGARLAFRMKDPGAGEWYELQARQIEKSILQHAQMNTEWIGASLNWTEGLNSKSSNLDVSVLLGVLHGEQDNFFKPSDPKVIKTFEKLTDVFAKIYPINRSTQDMAPGIGRYPEDIYAGTNFNGGNPWVLATLAAAEYSYKVARDLSIRNTKQSQKWMMIGDQFIQRVQYHANPDGTLSEQIDRYSGYMTSARDLTWNYSAVLTAFWARSAAENKIKLMNLNNKVISNNKGK